MSQSTADLVAHLTQLQDRIHALERSARTPQLPNSALGPGQYIGGFDEDGHQVARIGWQPDGGFTLSPEPGIGEPPPRPSTPQVAGGPAGVVVVWDGTLVDEVGEVGIPSDFDHVSVHVLQGDVPDFTPSAATFVATIPRAGGAYPVTPLPAGEVHTVRLVAVTTSGVEGAPSAAATGTPEAVGGVPAPGSITEVELAGDAVTTPKLRAEAVQAWHIVAQAIEAGHIQANAIEAAHLAATIVLASRLIAGTPGAARVEIDEGGLRGYDDDNELVFAIEDGSAVFTGTVTGSEITGSRIIMGSGGVTGQIESVGDAVTQRVLSGAKQAQLFASESVAEFSARLDTEDPSSPAAALYAMETQVGLTIDSSRLSADGLPSVTGTAFPGLAQLVLWSERNNNQVPFVALTADPTEVLGVWSAGDGSAVRLRASSVTASALFTPPSATDPDDRSGPGYVFATRNATSHVAAVSLQSPRWDEPGRQIHHRRSIIFAEGANPAQPYARITQAAQRVLVMGESTGAGYDTTTDGMLDLASTHSIRAPRHAPVRTNMASQPTAAGTGAWIDFTNAQMPALSFKTGWSGRVRITVTMCGYNNNTPGATLAIGFTLSGGSSVPVSLSRAAMVRSMGTGSGLDYGRQNAQTVHLNLTGNSEYTLQPVWRTSSSNPWSSSQGFDLNYQNSIVVEPLT